MPSPSLPPFATSLLAIADTAAAPLPATAASGAAAATAGLEEERTTSLNEILNWPEALLEQWECCLSLVVVVGAGVSAGGLLVFVMEALEVEAGGSLAGGVGSAQ